MTEKNWLSLCMITRNDENRLGSCLREIKQIADEIIIVDVGSTDHSVEIAKQAGAQVYQMVWNHSFSEVKNLCLEHAKGRWVLFLQPNETISADGWKEIRTLLDDPNAEGYLLYVEQGLEKYQIVSPLESLRLFRNRKEYRYSYRSFPYIPEETLFHIKHTGIRIHQHADTNLPGEIHSMALLQQDLTEHPDSNYLQYLYGIARLNQNRYEDSIPYLQAARKQVNLDYSYAPHVYKCLAWSYISLQHEDDALEVLDEGIRFFPFFTDFLVLRGELRKQKHQYEEAAKDLESSLKIREQYKNKTFGADINPSVILENLGELHEKLLNFRQALLCCRKALELNQQNSELLYKIGELSLKAEDAEVLSELLKTAAESQDLKRLMVLMDILYQHHEYRLVLNYLDYLESLLGKGEQIESIRYSCSLMLENMEEAEHSLSLVKKDTLFYYSMLIQQIEYLWLKDRWQDAELKLLELDQLVCAEDSVTELYHQIHLILTLKTSPGKLLRQQDYEMVSALHEKFLWLNQTEKAGLLLPMLVNGAEDDDSLVKVAALWADQTDIPAVLWIFRHITRPEAQIEFVKIIVEQLLRRGQLGAAKELMLSTESLPLGAVEVVLESRRETDVLEKWMEQIGENRGEASQGDASNTPLAAKPREALLNFYHQFLLFCNSDENVAPESEKQEISCAEIHYTIGKRYEKFKQDREALLAYLRSLQWDPLDESAQNKIRSSYLKDKVQFYQWIGEQKWKLEGRWFDSEEEFVSFVHGLIHFQNHDFEQEAKHFSEIGKNKAAYPLALAYRVSSLWLEGHQAEADNMLKEQNNFYDIGYLVFRICKNQITAQLHDAIQKYPHSEMILLEKQRVAQLKICD